MIKIRDVPTSYDNTCLLVLWLSSMIALWVLVGIDTSFTIELMHVCVKFYLPYDQVIVLVSFCVQKVERVILDVTVCTSHSMTAV